MMDYERLVDSVMRDEVADYVHTVLDEMAIAEIIRGIVRQQIEDLDIFEIVHDLIEDDITYSLAELVEDVIKNEILDR